METKICNTCNIEKELSSFYSFLDKRRGNVSTFAACRSCALMRARKWEKDNPDKVKVIARRNRVKNGKNFYRTFVEKKNKDWITYSNRRKKWARNSNKQRFDLAEKLVTLQGNKCAICEKPFKKLYDIDHSHETGLIRGLLCRKCNSGLHYFEGTESIKKAGQYLEKYPATNFPPTQY